MRERVRGPLAGRSGRELTHAEGAVSPSKVGLVPALGRLVPGRLPVVDLPDAGHHPMLDQPLALVTGLRTLLALWPAAADAG